jgi:AcrR family transcriptional regulator
MARVATRRYEQRARAEEAEKTRQRIVDAVLERLRAAPAEPIAIDRIAAMAGVARSTVYAIFGSRAGLFDAVGAHLQERTGYARLVAASHQDDARAALRGGLRAASEMLAADRDTWRALRSMAQLDQEAVGGSVQRWEDERAAAMTRIAQQLHEQGHLRPGVSVEEANDVLWVITSFESFDLLYTGRGLPLDAVVERLAETAERALIA